LRFLQTTGIYITIGAGEKLPTDVDLK